MREGDYLRQKVVLDDDDDDEQSTTTGCFRLPKSRSLSHIVKSSRLSESHDSPSMPTSPTSRFGRFAEKSVHFFRSTHSDPSVATKRKPLSPKRSRGGGQQNQGRRYMRVVRNENAPPPDLCSDNPNTVCRYSQEYLREYYSKKRQVEKSTRDGGGEKTTLPYTTSGQTILKKSLTDPSSERPAGGCSSAPTVVMATKHATFNDVVTIFDSDEHIVTTDHLRDVLLVEETVADEDESAGNASGEFFLAESSPEVTVTAETSASDEGLPTQSESMVTEEDRTDSCDSAVDSAAATATSTAPARCEASAMQNIFTTFSEPPSAFGLDSGARQPARSQLRRVKLENLMEQARVSGDSPKDDRTDAR